LKVRATSPQFARGAGGVAGADQTTQIKIIPALILAAPVLQFRHIESGKWVRYWVSLNTWYEVTRRTNLIAEDPNDQRIAAQTT
jgi:hypothetical protein